MSSNTIVQNVKKYVSGSHRFINVGTGSTSVPTDTLVTLAKSTIMTIENGNVGIGTTNPLQKLHVEGTSYLNGAISTNNNNINVGTGTVTATTFSGTATKVEQDLIRGTYLTGNNYNGASTTTWAVDATSANTASKVVVRDASGNFSAGTITASGLAGGSVGIGTTAPREILDVQGGNAIVSGSVGIGTTAPNDILTINVVGANESRGITFLEQGGQTYGGIIRYHTGQDRLILGTLENGTIKEGVSINRTTGNVGIGTTNALESFHLRGKAYIDNTATNAPANGVLGSTGTRIILWPGTASTVPYSIGIAANTLWYATQSIHAWYVGTTERMRLDANGNVGIGTTITRSKLHVEVTGGSGEYTPAMTLINNTGGSISTGIDFSTYGITSAQQPSARIQVIDSGYSGSFAFLSKSFGAIGNSLVERMRIDVNGNVGIGTATPLYPLDVAGTVEADRYISTIATGTAPITVTSTTACPNLNASLLEGNNAAFYRNVGNMNAGTLAAARGGTGATGFGGQYRIPIATSTTALGTNANFVYNYNTGNLGIGTATPTHKLHLYSASTVNGDYENAGIYLHNESTGEVGIALRNTTLGAGNVWVIGLNNSSSRFDIGYGAQVDQMGNAAVKLCINTNGNVGIGTITPTAKLDVNGDIILGSTGDNLQILGCQNPIIIGGALSDETSALNTSNVLKLYAPYNFNVRNTKLPKFTINTAATSTITFDITKNGTTIYSVKPTITSTNVTSSTTGGTLTTNPILFSENDTIIASVNTAGNGGTGAKLYIYCT